MKTFRPTALETKDCPPHLWYIKIDDKNRDGMGYCTKPGCKATKDFSGNGHKADRKELYRELMHRKCSEGGKKNKKAGLMGISQTDFKVVEVRGL